MKRTILFKAKRLDNSEWVEGDLVHQGLNVYIYNLDENGMLIDTEVDPSTVCQFTGLKDKDGKEIWEHDYLSGYREGEVIYEMGMFSLKTDVITVPLDMFMKDVLGNIRSKTRTSKEWFEKMYKMHEDFANEVKKENEKNKI